MDLNGIDSGSVIAVLALLSFLFACFKFMIRPLEKGQKELEKGQMEIKETLKILLSRQAPQAPAGSQGK